MAQHTLLVTFLNLATAFSLTSFTVISSPASQGTKMRVSPKHTITFIANFSFNRLKNIDYCKQKSRSSKGQREYTRTRAQEKREALWVAWDRMISFQQKVSSSVIVSS